MNAVASAVLLGWVPIALLIFARLPPRIAVLTVVIGGWLFLPIMSLSFAGLPEYDKSAAISVSLLLGVALFDLERLTHWRPALTDLVFAMWVAAAPLTSLANGAGPYDAASSLLARMLEWGIPYFIGSLYFRTLQSMREAIWAVFLGGLVYMPLCLYEIRFSPQLHRIVYGSHQHAFDQTFRGGGFRPMVFTEHGLELSMWMAAATLAGVALWRQLGVKRCIGMPMSVLVVALGTTFVLCKSTGALLLGCVGLLLMIPRFGPLLNWAMLLAIPVYLLIRLFGGGALEQTLVEWAHAASEDRAASLEFRFTNEALFLRKFWDQPLFGTSPWTFNLNFDAETGELRLLTSDSMWIIALTMYGTIGLLGWLGSLWMPALRSLRSKLVRTGATIPQFTTAGIILTLYAIDGMTNAFTNAVFLAIAGGLGRIPLNPPETGGHMPQQAATALPLAHRLVPRLAPRLSLRSSLTSAAPAPRQPVSPHRPDVAWLLPRDRKR